MAMAAFTVAIALSAFRVLFPAMAGFAERTSNEAAAGVVVAVFSVPLVTPMLRRLTGRFWLPIAVGALATWRVAVLLGHTVSFAAAIIGAVVALFALTTALTDDSVPGTVTPGVVGGLVVDVASRASFITWDPVWQRSAPAIVVGVCSGVALLVLVVLVHRDRADDQVGPVIGHHGGGFGSGIAFGAVLALEVLFLSSPGFVASSADVALPVAVALVLVGLAAASATLLVDFGGRRHAVLAATLFATVGAVLPAASGFIAVSVLVVAGQVLAATVVATALGRQGTVTRRRSEAGFAVGWLVFALTVLLYQVHFDQPLPFDNRWIVAAAGGLTGLAWLRSGTVGLRSFGRMQRHAAAWLGAAGLFAAAALPLGMAMTVDTSSAIPTVRSLRVVEWNVRQAVTDDGQLDPEGVARALEQSGPPDVVVLVEVARGWPMSGDLDLASWLSRRLRLSFVWGGAADDQFGNLVLSRLPILDSDVVDLPVAGDAQGRSLVRAELGIGDGKAVTVLATHLQHRNDPTSTAVRLSEIDLMLQRWDDAPRTMIVGDLNPRQGDPPTYPTRVPRSFEEVSRILAAGFTTAADLDACSAPTSNRNCSDFVFVTPDLTETSYAVNPTSLSDHNPIVTMVALGS